MHHEMSRVQRFLNQNKQLYKIAQTVRQLTDKFLVVNLSQDVFNERSGTVIAVAITSRSQRAGFPLTLELHPNDLPKRSWVKISQIHTLSTERVGRRFGAVMQEELDQIIDGLNEFIGS